MNQFKRIFGVSIFTLLIFSIIYCKPVYADTGCTDYFKKLAAEQYSIKDISKVSEADMNTYISDMVIGVFGVTTLEKDGKLYLALNPDSNDSSLKNKLSSAKFKLVSLNGNLITNGEILSASKKFEVKNNYKSIVFESVTDSEHPYCKGTFKFKYEYDNNGYEPHSDSSDVKVPDKPGDVINSPVIDCNKTYSRPSFEDSFCSAKKFAIGNKTKPDNKTYFSFAKDQTYYSTFGKDSFNNFYCDYKTIHNSDELIGDKYYVNKNYLYGMSVYTIDTLGNYTYHKDPSKETPGEKITCERKCEESVVVEYGPPVASIAGLCFEYKVKVTSRVTCGISKYPNKPQPVTGNYCTPAPLCTNLSGMTFQQGGPNEDFDKCIKKCDGGKYTSACSSKCYNKIYGSSTKKTVNNLLSYETKKLETAINLDYCVDKNIDQSGGLYRGCYYWDGNAIKWYDKKAFQPGRWYIDEINRGRSWAGYGIHQDDGFYRHTYANDYCHDYCVWYGCSKDQYLNPYIEQIDVDNNYEKYYKAIDACSAKATCSTTQAEFTIKVDYKDSKNQVQTISYPYDSNKPDTKQSVKNEDTNSTTHCTVNPDFTKGNSIILDHNGCYNCGQTASRLDYYMTEWSFPGSWLNKKTGEVTYDYDTGNNSGSWRSVPDKFCLPLNAGNVNTVWYKYYYSKINIPIDSIKYYDSDKQCRTSGCISHCDLNSNSSIKIPSDSDIKWNIDAYTTKFGYFDWNIDMKCFYALDSGTGEKNSDASEGTDVPLTCNSSENYRVRTVDLADLFPKEDGSSSSNSSAVAGRQPGFNWTNASTISLKQTMSTDRFVVNPEALIKKVQTNASAIYDISNLDYQVVLTPSDIKKLRNDINNHKFTDFCLNGSNCFVSNNGIDSYKSPLLDSFGRNGAKSADKTFIPSDSTIGCNNISADGKSCEEVK